MHRISNSLIIEFIPKDDPKLQKLLSSREDVFFEYNEKYFEEAFKQKFTIVQKIAIEDSKRIIYFLKSKI